MSRVAAPRAGDSEYRRVALLYPSQRVRQEKYHSLGEDIRKGNARWAAYKSAGMTHKAAETKVSAQATATHKATRQIEPSNHR